MKNFWQKIKKLFLKFFLINDTPQKVAGGAALGVFLGMIPGEGVTASLVLSSIFRLNRLAAITGALATNMWTTFFVLPIATFVGAFLFNKNSHELIQHFNQNYHLAGYKFFLSKVAFFDLALPLLVGFLVTAGIIALLAYFILLYLLKNHKMEFTRKDHKNLYN
jgi:uncharacterized protein (DUF2062 family)